MRFDVVTRVFIGMVAAGVLTACSGGSGAPATSSAPSGYSGPSDMLAKMKSSNMECEIAGNERTTSEGGQSVGCSVAEDALIITTYPSATGLKSALQKAANLPGADVDVLVGENWTVACGTAKTATCTKLQAALGGEIQKV